MRVIYLHGVIHSLPHSNTLMPQNQGYDHSAVLIFQLLLVLLIFVFFVQCNFLFIFSLLRYYFEILCFFNNVNVYSI